MSAPTQDQIKESLERSGTNLCAWSTERKYNYPTVFTTVKRWAGRADKTPHGGIARQIMSDLADYVRSNGDSHGQVD